MTTTAPDEATGASDQAGAQAGDVTGADAPAATPVAPVDQAPSVAPGQLVRFAAPTIGGAPGPQVAAIVLAVTPATADAPERVRVAELGRESVLDAARIRSV